MILHHEHLVQQGKIYRHDMMAFAEHERLIRLATTHKRRSLLHPLLSWTGRRMVRAGMGLLAMTETQPVEARTVTYRRA